MKAGDGHVLSSHGELPHKRHVQFRKADGSLYREQVMGTKVSLVHNLFCIIIIYQLK